MKRLLTVLFVLHILGSPVNLFSQPLNISSYAEVYLQNDLRLDWGFGVYTNVLIMTTQGLNITRDGRIYATMGTYIHSLGDYLESYGLKGKVKSVKHKFLQANESFWKKLKTIFYEKCIFILMDV